MTAKGELERSILEVLWDHDDGLTAKELVALLHERNLALTTVLTVLERLRSKNLVLRRDETRPLRFYAAMTRDHYIAAAMLDVLGQAPDRGAALTMFLGGVTNNDVEHMRTVLDTSIEHPTE
jgi:predicted transcriptional regulator